MLSHRVSELKIDTLSTSHGSCRRRRMRFRNFALKVLLLWVALASCIFVSFHSVKVSAEFDILEAEAEDFEGLAAATRLSDAASCFRCRFRDCCIQVLITIRHEQNVASHDKHLSIGECVDSSMLVNCRAEFVVAK